MVHDDLGFVYSFSELVWGGLRSVSHLFSEKYTKFPMTFFVVDDTKIWLYHTFEIFTNFVKIQVYAKMAITPLLTQKFAKMTWGLSNPPQNTCKSRSHFSWHHILILFFFISFTSINNNSPDVQEYPLVIIFSYDLYYLLTVSLIVSLLY